MTGPLRNCPEGGDTTLACDILRYLSAHNDARDTLEGIAQWWLLREWAERRLQDIERAIVVLEEAGLVVKKVQPGGEPLYGLNPAKGLEIKRLLSEEAPESE